MISRTCVHCGDVEGILEGGFVPLLHFPDCKWINKKWWQFWIKEKYR